MSGNIKMDLLRWIDDPRRKTLILLGEWGFLKNRLIRRLAHGSNRVIVEADLSKDGASALFEGEDAAEMVKRLEKFTGKEITADRSLLYLKESQKCPELIEKLKFFSKDLPKLPIIVTGSHLDSLVKGLSDKEVTYLRYSPYSLNEFQGDIENRRTMYRVKQED